MTLDEVRKSIDAIDSEIRALVMKRMDCSLQVAQVKTEARETNIYRADREEAILNRLGEGIPEDRKAGYLSVVRKIMETSRMYQYGLMYDWMDGVMDEHFNGLDIREGGRSVRVSLTRENRPNAMSSILSMIGDYGFNMNRMELIKDDHEAGTVTFELEILGDLSCTHMKKLMFQLSRESKDFRIIGIA